MSVNVIVLKINKINVAYICNTLHKSFVFIFVLATDKVALLIGNLNYSNHPKLMAPVLDVRELSNHLQHLGFRVVSLLDLTREEMLASITHFIDLLDKGVYGWYINYFSIYFDMILCNTTGYIFTWENNIFKIKAYKDNVTAAV